MTNQRNSVKFSYKKRVYNTSLKKKNYYGKAHKIIIACENKSAIFIQACWTLWNYEEQEVMHVYVIQNETEF